MDSEVFLEYTAVMAKLGEEPAKCAPQKHPIRLNLRLDVLRAWRTTQQGCSDTVFSIMGLAAFRVLSETDQKNLSNLARAVDKASESATWADIQKWVDAHQATADEQVAGDVEKSGVPIPGRTHKKKPKAAQR